MINDAAITLDNRWKYVDDLSLAEIVTKREPSGMQLHINALMEWCLLNDMKPNPGKCKAMQISFLHNPPPPLSLQISDAELEVVSSVKLIGVTIQNNLKWDQQVQKLITNGSRRLYILSRLRKNGVKPNDLI